MNINLPWISSRVYLLFFCVTDFLLFFILIKFIYPILFLDFKGDLISALFLFFILILSYILGRYFIDKDKNELFFLKSIFINSIKFLISIVFFLIIIRSKNLLNLSYLYQFKFLITFISLSSLSQIPIYLYFCKKRNRQKYWYFIGEKKLFDNLVFNIKNSISLNRVKYLNNSLTKEIEKKLKGQNYGLIIEEISNLKENEQSFVYKLKSEGIIVISAINWCNIFLQSIPPSLLKVEDIIRDNYFMNNDLMSMRIKRLADFLVSIILLLTFSPVLIIAGLLIKVQDSGSIFYSQLRTGYKGVPFRIWKLRTMREGAELNGAQWASNNDPRVTFLGSFLRKTRIDELPQLLSVISGKMSLIGPRPERPEFDVFLEKEISFYSMRQMIKPGLSGWAQVNYPYGASLNDAKMKLSFDLYYLKNFSNLIDILILFKTIKLVLTLRGSTPK